MDRENKKTALITGASSGLGAEFARQLAERGYTLMLVARRQERLEALITELQDKYAIPAEAIPADLSTDIGIELVVKRINNLENLTLLVNNAGFGVAGKFAEADISKHVAMIQVHVMASARLSHAALTGMIKHAHGGIINVASIAALLPIRGSNYAATKAYLFAFSEALQNEVHGTGVQVQVLCPGFTITGFHDTQEYQGFRREKIPKILWLPATQVVRESLEALENRQVICIPGWQYRLIVRLTRNSLIGQPFRAIAKKFFRR